MKSETKRIIIFLLFAFAFTWGIQLLEHSIASDAANQENISEFLLTIACLGPALANVFTRLVTKEGFTDTGLRICGKDIARLPGGKKQAGHYYLLAVFVPIAAATMQFFIETACLGIPIKTDVSLSTVISFMLFQSASGFCFMFTTVFGEEFGWCGYLYPKLEKCLHTGWAVLLTSVIWFAWHLCMYIGWEGSSSALAKELIGFFAMTLTVRVFFILVTKKTGSVYPGTIAHMVRGNTVVLLPALLLSESSMETMNNGSILVTALIGNLPWIFLAVISLIILGKTKKAL